MSITPEDLRAPTLDDILKPLPPVITISQEQLLAIFERAENETCQDFDGFTCPNHYREKATGLLTCPVCHFKQLVRKYLALEKGKPQP